MGSCPPQTLALPKDRSPHSPLTKVQRPPCRLCRGRESRVNSLCDRGAQRLTEEQGQRGWWRGSDHSPRHKRGGSEGGRQGINEGRKMFVSRRIRQRLHDIQTSNIKDYQRAERERAFYTEHATWANVGKKVFREMISWIRLEQWNLIILVIILL